MASTEAPIVIAPALEPFEIAYRAWAANRHMPVYDGRAYICQCGAALPCTAATAVLADVAADVERIRSGPQHAGRRRHPDCPHEPACPAAEEPDREAARVVAAHPEQGWSRLCNGVVVFDDTGALLPDGQAVAPHRAVPGRRLAHSPG